MQNNPTTSCARKLDRIWLKLLVVRLQTIQNEYAKRLEIRGEQNTSVAPAVLTAKRSGRRHKPDNPTEPQASTDPEKPAQSLLWLLVGGG